MLLVKCFKLATIGFKKAKLFKACHLTNKNQKVNKSIVNGII